MVSLHPPRGLLDIHLKSCVFELNIVIMITGVHESQLEITGSCLCKSLLTAGEALAAAPAQISFLDGQKL